MNKFIAKNSYGELCEFKEDDIVKAIYIAWNYESDLYIIVENRQKLLFAPLEDNEFNNYLLKDYGYMIRDGEKYREIVNSKNEVVKFEWENCLDLNFVYDKYVY
jgi:hypothetical protein